MTSPGSGAMRWKITYGKPTTTISRVPATNLELAGHILAFGRERADRLNALIKQFRHVCNH